jgi:hypothetical protein
LAARATTDFSRLAQAPGGQTFFVSGSTHGGWGNLSAGPARPYVAALSLPSTLLWTAYLPSPAASDAKALAASSEGGPIVAEGSQLRYFEATNGSIFRNVSIGNATHNAITTSANVTVVVGMSYASSVPNTTSAPGGGDISIVVIAADASVRYSALLGSPQLDSAVDAVLLSDNSVVLAGYSENNGTLFNRNASQTGCNAIAMRLAAESYASVWNLTFGGNGSDEAVAVAVRDSVAVVTGFTASSSFEGIATFPVVSTWVVALNHTDGARLWTQLLSPPDPSTASFVAADVSIFENSIGTQ